MGEEDRLKKVVFFTDLNNLHDAFENFDAVPDACVAVFWGEGGAMCG